MQTYFTVVFQVWSECDDVQDYVTVYDGYTTRDPVLLKFCGGGEPVPEAVSSGPEILVEFTSSPYGTFVYPAPLQALHGFQLEVQVRGGTTIDTAHIFHSFFSVPLTFPLSNNLHHWMGRYYGKVKLARILT
jgi:CUB domain.